LEELGKDISNLTLEDLHPVDEFHIRGTTRRLSHYIGCRVTGVDLSNEYIDVAQRLTQLFYLQERVRP